MTNDPIRYRQRHLFEVNPLLATTKIEDQWFDRKSARLDPKELANALVGFANADGGTLVIGVEKSGIITGTDSQVENVNRLRQAAIDYTSPPVRHTIAEIDCVNDLGQSDHLLIIEVHPSDRLHRNHRNEVFKRIGDQTRRLTDEDARELAYDKGERPFDGMPVPGATVDDLDQDALREFATSIGAGDDIERALRVRGLITFQDGVPAVTAAGLLLFGTDPQASLPGSFVRILRYDGVLSQPGTRSNLIFDRRIGGRLTEQIEAVRQIMLNQLREVTRLDDQSGQFVTIPEIPRFAWLEAIVNAVTHRSYSLQGGHIRVTLFDDRLEVESPGRLPGPVRIDNIRRTRFSRNPQISRALSGLRFVQELNEGMNRMFDEMSRVGLPEPVLQQTDAGFKVTLFNSSELERSQVQAIVSSVPEIFAPALDHLFTQGRITTSVAANLTGLALPTVRRYLRDLEAEGLLERIARSPKDPHAYWRPPTPLRGRWRFLTAVESERTRKPTRKN
jgi:ATP-dependent DNA helicase RecG